MKKMKKVIVSSCLAGVMASGVFVSGLQAYAAGLPEGFLAADDIRGTLYQVTQDMTVAGLTGYKNFGLVAGEETTYIRSTPDENAEVSGILPVNAGCDILEVGEEWTLIRSGEVEGYVKAEAVVNGQEAIDQARQIKQVVAKSNADNLRVRADADSNSQIVKELSEGEETEVVEILDGWVKIASDEQEGYISMDYLEISEQLPEAIPIGETDYEEGISELRIAMVEYAKEFLGNPYVYGGTSLTDGTDCSGFTMRIYEKFDMKISRTSIYQAENGRRIEPADVKPGDLLFYERGGVINHVAMYIGNSQVIHASTEKTGIRISNIGYRTPVCAVRIIED